MVIGKARKINNFWSSYSKNTCVHYNNHFHHYYYCHWLGSLSLSLVTVCHCRFHWTWPLPLLLRSLSNDDGDGNENGKKAMGLNWQNNNFARASHFLVHFLAVVARLQSESASFRVFRTQLQKKLPALDEPNEME